MALLLSLVLTFIFSPSTEAHDGHSDPVLEEVMAKKIWKSEVSKDIYAFITLLARDIGYFRLRRLLWLSTKKTSEKRFFVINASDQKGIGKL